MDKKYRDLIAQEFRSCVNGTISRISESETYRPFHTALLSEEVIFWSRFERSFSTSFGQRVIEGIAKIVAFSNGAEDVQRQRTTLVMGADPLVKQSEYMLDAICKSGLTEFTRRDIMRLCRSFKTADEVQPVLNHLTEYGYIVLKTADAHNSKGRPTGQTYLVNPYLYEKAS